MTRTKNGLVFGEVIANINGVTIYETRCSWTQWLSKANANSMAICRGVPSRVIPLSMRNKHSFRSHITAALVVFAVMETTALCNAVFNTLH